MGGFLHPSSFPLNPTWLPGKREKVARGAKLTDRVATHSDGEGNITSGAAQGDHTLLLANAVSLCGPRGALFGV